MSSLWVRTDDQEHGWRTLPVEAGRAAVAHCGDEMLRIVAAGSSGVRRVALLAPRSSAVHVNGERVVWGIRMLAHRDEIALADGCVMYFSDEAPAVVRVFELGAGQAAPRCPVCRRDIENQQSVVACPRCGRVYHQAAEASDPAAKCCWSYREACLCGHPTGLSEDAVWRPDKESVHV